MHYQTALITGASSGIGRDFAHQLASQGYHCILLARSQDKLHDVVKSIQASGGSAEYHIVDLSDVQTYPAVIEEILSHHQIDVLINNAGFGMYGDFETLDITQQLNMIDLNCKTLTYLMHRIGRHILDRQSHGYILNIASTASFQPGPSMAVYFASKAYVLSVSEAVRFERSKQGVYVSTLCPGATQTDFFDRSQTSHTSLLTKSLMSSQEVVRSGLKGLFAHQDLIIPGWKNKLLYVLTVWSPRSWVVKIVAYMIKGSACVIMMIS